MFSHPYTDQNENLNISDTLVFYRNFHNWILLLKSTISIQLNKSWTIYNNECFQDTKFIYIWYLNFLDVCTSIYGIRHIVWRVHVRSATTESRWGHTSKKYYAPLSSLCIGFTDIMLRQCEGRMMKLFLKIFYRLYGFNPYKVQISTSCCPPAWTDT